MEFLPGFSVSANLWTEQPIKNKALNGRGQVYEPNFLDKRKILTQNYYESKQRHAARICAPVSYRVESDSRGFSGHID